MRSLLARLFRRAPRIPLVDEFRAGLAAGMAAAEWVRITEPRSALDRRLLHAWPAVDLWAPKTGGARVAYVVRDDLLQSWSSEFTIGWLAPHASSMPVCEALHALQHNKVIGGAA